MEWRVIPRDTMSSICPVVVGVVLSRLVPKESAGQISTLRVGEIRAWSETYQSAYKMRTV